MLPLVLEALLLLCELLDALLAEVDLQGRRGERWGEVGRGREQGGQGWVWGTRWVGGGQERREGRMAG